MQRPAGAAHGPGQGRVESISAVSTTCSAAKKEKRPGPGKRWYTVDEFTSFYVARKGFDPTYGARPVKRAIQSELIQVIANNLLRGIFQEDDTIVATANGDGVNLTSGPKIVRELAGQDHVDRDENFASPARTNSVSFDVASSGDFL